MAARTLTAHDGRGRGRNYAALDSSQALAPRHSAYRLAHCRFRARPQTGPAPSAATERTPSRPERTCRCPSRGVSALLAEDPVFLGARPTCLVGTFGAETCPMSPSRPPRRPHARSSAHPEVSAKPTFPIFNRKPGVCGTRVPLFYTFSTGVDDAVDKTYLLPAYHRSFAHERNPLALAPQRKRMDFPGFRERSDLWKTAAGPTTMAESFDT